MNELSLFTGAGGGLLGTHLLGWRPVGYVEWDDYCQRVIAARIRDGYLPIAPIFTDVREFAQSGAADQYRGIADVVTAGFPCQPFSLGGKQLGEADERNMWPATADVIRRVRPRFVGLENVAGLVTSGYIGTVLGDLAAMGLDARWGVLGGHHVGAAQRRERVWLFANAAGERSDAWHRLESGQKWRSSESDRGLPRLVKPQSWRPSDKGAHSECGLPGLAYGVPNSVDRLRASGNGQIPIVAATAFTLLSNQ
ncbi:MAG TPA: DNA cytosine methyltransferase [Sphingomicrobium sp.]|nr:DNA cytosine methyltransferase [Sphingomicrobium sp.]